MCQAGLIRTCCCLRQARCDSQVCSECRQDSRALWWTVRSSVDTEMCNWCRRHTAAKKSSYQMMRVPNSKNGVTWLRFVRAASVFCRAWSQKWSVLFSMFDLSPLHHCVLDWQVFFYIDQFKAHYKGAIHSSKIANIILTGLTTKYRWTPFRVQNRIQVRTHPF